MTVDAANNTAYRRKFRSQTRPEVEFGPSKQFRYSDAEKWQYSPAVRGRWSPGMTESQSCITHNSQPYIDNIHCVRGRWSPGMTESQSFITHNSQPYIYNIHCVRGRWSPGTTESQSCITHNSQPYIYNIHCERGRWLYLSPHFQSLKNSDSLSSPTAPTVVQVIELLPYTCCMFIPSISWRNGGNSSYLS
jgi:cyclophilin family peptidyl-prolyl cis-trans isomerase